MPKLALYAAAVIFAIVSIAHFVRTFLRLEFILGSVAIPLPFPLSPGSYSRS